MRKSYKNLFTGLFILTALFAGFSPASGKDIRVTASVNRNPVGVNEQFRYQLEIKGGFQSLPEPSLPDFADFRIVAGPSVSSNFQYINGKVTNSKTYTVILLPRKTGTFRIPPVTIKYKGKRYQSNEIVITVTPGSSSPGNKQRQSRGGSSLDVFLRAIPSKRSAYVNEQVSVSYKVYFRVNIRNPEFVKLPETVGFWVEEFELPKDIPIKQEVINGIRYNVAELKKLALFPTKPGDLRVTPMQLAVDVVQRRRRDPFDMFDDFFDNPLGRTVRKVFTSNEVRLKVKPVPEQNKPANFTGLVGSLTLRVDVDKTTVAVNEAISYKIRLTGSGNLKSLRKLNIEFPATFEVFEPKVQENVHQSGNKLLATREMEYVLIPRTSGEFHIDPLSITYFDPGRAVYRTITGKEFTITVTPGSGATNLIANSYLPKSEIKLLGKDINFIKEERLSLRPIGYKPYHQPWFWGSIISCTLLLLAAVGYRRHLDKMATNTEYARKRKAYKFASARLKGARAYLKQGKLAEFYGEISRGLIGFVADKTNTPAAGLVRDDVEKLLMERKIDSQLIADYLKLLDEADFRRFAPGDVTPEQATEFYHRAETLLSKLGKYF